MFEEPSLKVGQSDGFDFGWWFTRPPAKNGVLTFQKEICCVNRRLCVLFVLVDIRWQRNIRVDVQFARRTRDPHNMATKDSRFVLFFQSTTTNISLAQTKPRRWRDERQTHLGVVCALGVRG